MSADPQSDPASGAALSREQILRALESLSDQLGRQGVTGEVCLFGGTVMMLAFTDRQTTKVVDAIFQPAQVIRQQARRIADDLHLPPDWLKEVVAGFGSARHETTTENLPQFPHLRLMMPVPEYLLAMKCVAARIGRTAAETSDIVFLIRHLNLKSAKGVWDLVGQYFPATRIPVKMQNFVKGLFEAVKT
jgi:hypothetical protein